MRRRAARWGLILWTVLSATLYNPLGISLGIWLLAVHHSRS